MSHCECLPGCDLYNDRLALDPEAARAFKVRYCLIDNSACARHLVFRAFGKGSVPKNLLPHQVARARRIVLGLEPHA